MCANDNITRYIEIWEQLRIIPVIERPTELRKELDDIWNEFTNIEKAQLDRTLETRG